MFFLTGINPVTTGFFFEIELTGFWNLTGIRREAPKIGDWNMTGILARSPAKKWLENYKMTGFQTENYNSKQNFTFCKAENNRNVVLTNQFFKIFACGAQISSGNMVLETFLCEKIWLEYLTGIRREAPKNLTGIFDWNTARSAEKIWLELAKP